MNSQLSVEAKQKGRRFFIGRVVSVKMLKTFTIELERTFEHKWVHKVVKRKKKFLVHDESSLCRVGDVVSVYEGAPISKRKYMYLDRVIEQAKG
jgi:small subunit ribosomal protein S17